MKKILTLIAGCFALGSVAVAGEYEDISIADLEAAIKDGKVALIDVNGSRSYSAVGHIPGAIDYAASAEKLGELLPADKDTLVVAYCGSPQCMAYKAGAKAAAELGYTNVKHLSAGINGWLDAGKSVEKD